MAQSGLDERWSIKYNSDEIQIKLAPIHCLQPWACSCQKDESGRCTYSAEEARQEIIKYYEQKLQYLKKQSIEDFLHDQGFYYSERIK